MKKEWQERLAVGAAHYYAVNTDRPLNEKISGYLGSKSFLRFITLKRVQQQLRRRGLDGNIFFVID